MKKSNLEITNNRKLYTARLLAIGSIPYVIFMFALLFLSIGIFNYIENESLFAILLTNRDSIISAREWNEKDYTFSISDELPQIDEDKRTVKKENRRLVVPFFYVGDRIGTIRIPQSDLEAPAIRGDGDAQLRIGAGHSLHSYLPGQGSNILFGAHHTTHFKKLEHVQIGYIIYFDTAYGRFVYEIDDIFIIKGNDDSVAEPTENEQLTLYTCYPFIYYGNAPERFIVTAKLIESEIFE